MIPSWTPTPFMRAKRPSPAGSRPPSMRSAGNFLGTTRYVQPGPSAQEARTRPDRISDGVCASFPGQKGQVRGSTLASKSDGRWARSVAMITQRPTTGSFLSSGNGPTRPRRPRVRGVLSRGRPGQEGGQRLPRRPPLEEHGAHGLTDRHADTRAARERQRGANGGDSLRHHARGAPRLIEGTALRQGHAEGAIAREATRTGEDQVAETAEAREGLRSRSEGNAQPGDLGEPPGDERCSGVLAEAKAVAQPGGQSDGV